MVLDREMEDERDKDPVDLSTNKYKGDEDKAKLTNNKAINAIDEGIARYKYPSKKNRLMKVLSE